MRFSLIMLLLLTSCADYSVQKKFSTPYTSKGFAHISNSDNNILDNKFVVSVVNIKTNKKIRISNPENNKFIELKNSKKSYDNFYKALISPIVASELELDPEFPYIEVTEIKKNKSFIAEKAITDIAEKKIANNAPIEKININNISRNKDSKKKKLRTYFIIIADFYSLKSAKSLKDRLVNDKTVKNSKLLSIKEKNSKNYELFMGPYKTINNLKNDYIALIESGFEDLDIKNNE